MARLTIEHDGDGERGRRRARSVALRLDGKAWLRVEPDALAEIGAADGDEIDDARRIAIEEAVARTRARLFVVRSLAAKAQSVSEIERKLAARDVPEALAREAIAAAAGYGYLDDAELAGRLARGMRGRGYGRRRAEQTLRARGIGAEHAQAALRDAYGDEDEAELARAALARRAVADDAARRRAVAFLVRRGFSAGAAWQAVREELAARREPPHARP
ncbi:Regulatory protein RecX-related protein [Gaiella occulta]|uniref:Regulatory protein RecX n=1 Tax=Gaiella occulta TaxID=1002870 RepID=A0A7M2Z114_9ACTN|nr:RecX family transcriptional regulator [Gaiella occulta]RDI75463.1 Regulatory protein RecX-related protein [Gaiella occulta]